MSLLNSVVSIVAWIHGWDEPNFGMGGVSSIGLKSFGMCHEKWHGLRFRHG